MAVSELADGAARSRILTEHGTTFFVEAAAGTGKTTALVGRIVGLIRSGAGTLARTVAVTFTEKAAGEMKLRLRLEIEKARATGTREERGRLDRALEELELARIGTIHAFCGDLLGERPVEAGVDPRFKLAAEDEARALVNEAFETWLERILADPPEGTRRILRRASDREPPHQQLRAALHALCDHRDFPTPWRRDPFDRDGAIDALLGDLAQLGELADTSSWADDWLTRNLAEINRFVQEVTRLEAVQGRRDYDGLEAELRDLAFNRRRIKGWEHKGAAKTTFGDLARDEVLSRRDAVRTQLLDFVAASDSDLAPLVHEALQAAIGEYELLKSKSGSLDFLDLLIKTRDLVRDNDGVRRELQLRFSHFFIDEFQDTDPLQAEILLLLAADDPGVTNWHAVRPVPGKLFLVGDPKQSIYRFRRADVALYEEVKRLLLSAGAELLHLTTSFRMPPSIQRLVNGAFAPAMATDAEASAYVGLEPFRPEVADRPTIVALPVPKPYGDFGTITERSINQSLPDAVGAFVDWLIRQSGWTVEEDDRPVAIQPRHVALLFRRFRSFHTDITRPYVSALESRRVPHVLVGGRSFHDREEIIALRNAITAIEWPDDELKVFATLRGPLFALGDEALLLFRQRIDSEGKLTVRRLNPIRALEWDGLDPGAAQVADALQLLRRLHIGRNSRPIAETITLLLQAVRAHAGIALWPNGEQALANCQRLVDMARHFERGASSFRGFVERMEADAKEGRADEAPIVEEGTEGVRVMTVYRAKGLEFPIVILADPTYKAVRSEPTRHIDASRSLWLEPLCGAVPIELREASDLESRRDVAEAIRVAYVATTRARDLLVVPTCGDAPIEGWYDVLDPLIYPADAARRSSGFAPGCPPFGDDSVLERGRKGQTPIAGSVRPGLHASPADGVPIVWWDPAALRLDVDELAPLRHQWLLEPEEDGAAAAESQRDYEAWKAGRASLLADASRPMVAVQAVTASVRSAAARAKLGFVAAPGELEVEVERIDREQLGRPSGRRFGALVHSLLASIDLSADASSVREMAAVQGRIVGATEDEVSAAATIISRVLNHPILRRAAAVSDRSAVRRETPILLTLEDGSLLEGVVDLVFRDAGDEGWTVVDFKTDREVEGSLEAYVAQVQVYSRAVATATGSHVRGILFVI